MSAGIRGFWPILRSWALVSAGGRCYRLCYSFLWASFETVGDEVKATPQGGSIDMIRGQRNATVSDRIKGSSKDVLPQPPQH